MSPEKINTKKNRNTFISDEKQVILLNGPSSSGKSTLSRSLKKIIEDGCNKIYEIISIDDFMKIEEDETIYEDDVFEISGDMCNELQKLLQSKDGVIIDHVITSERIYEQLLEAVKEFDLIKVHVTCPVEILIGRETARGNRCKGSAEDSFNYLYPKNGYDLTVDTSVLTSEEAASIIYEHIIE